MKKKPWLAKVLIISTLTLIAVFFIVNYIVWTKNYQNQVYPGIKIGNLALGGKTLSEVQELISQQGQEIESAGLSFNYNSKSATLNASTISFDSDLAYSAFSLDIEQSAKNAYGKENEKTFLTYLFNFLIPKDKKTVKAVYTLNNEIIKTFLADNFSELNINAENAYFSVTNQGAEDFQINRNPERLGKEINYDEAIQEIKNNLDNLRHQVITIRTRSQYPTVYASDLNNLEPNIESLVNRGNLVLWSEKNAEGTSTTSWKIKTSRLVTWASVQKINDNLELYFDQEKIKEYLATTIAPEVNQEVILPRFEIKNGRVTSWQTGKNGRELDLDSSANEITKTLLEEKNETTLITKEVTAENLTADNNLQIKEKIGTGYSNFTGSSVSRRHNISTGAATLHGLLIKPGEEFSLIKTLGDVSAETGYLPELVIKGDKTVPEFGGGLCQVGTTIFRTALASGLPITMRQNHSYRVSYYEPAGTDATIYIPQPDLRFINDTGNYVLIQARIDKNNLYFDFWGTKDGRVATTTAPVIYNIVKPEATKIIESDSLKPGEKKCTESSHNGADAYFDYTVTYPEESTTTPVHERRFKSHYIPWRAVCLIGKATSSSPTTINPTATSTKKAADESTASSTTN